MGVASGIVVLRQDSAKAASCYRKIFVVSLLRVVFVASLFALHSAGKAHRLIVCFFHETLNPKPQPQKLQVLKPHLESSSPKL